MLRDNPFYILRIPMRAPKEKVMAAAETQSLRSDSGMYDHLAYQLVNPVKRLEAELDWFPQEDDETVSVIMEAVRKGEPVFHEMASVLSDLGRINAAVYDLSISDPDTWADSPGDRDKVKVFDAIEKNLGSYLSHDLLTAINEERQAAGISGIDMRTLYAEDAAKKERIADSLSDLIGKMTCENRLSFMNILADSAKGADPGAALLFCMLADRFETGIIAEYSALSEELKDIINGVTAHGGILDTGFRIRKYNRKLTEWLRYDRPLQIAAALRGASRQESTDMLVRSLGMTERIVKKDDPVNCYEFLEQLEEQFAALPCAKIMIAGNRKQVGDLITKLTRDTPENIIRKRRFGKKASLIGNIMLIAMFLFIVIRVLISPSETELAQDPSSSYYGEIRLPYSMNYQGEYEEVSMPPTGFIFQDTMGDEGRSVSLTIRGPESTDSFVRISDRDYGNDTHIYLPGEEAPLTDKLPSELDREILREVTGEDPQTYNGVEQIPADAAILSVMVRAGEETQVTLPPGEYYLSWDHGKTWYGWKLRFTAQPSRLTRRATENIMPEMSPLADTLYIFEEDKSYCIEPEPEL